MAPWATELAVTVAGGVITAVIINLFTSRNRQGPAPAQNQTATSAPARRGTAFGHFMHLALAVLGGVAFALIAGRYLFHTGVLDRSLPMRLGLLAGATVFFWWLLLILRRW